MILFYVKDFLLLFGIIFMADGIATMVRNAKALLMEKTQLYGRD
jgi:hypothetical protein